IFTNKKQLWKEINGNTNLSKYSLSVIKVDVDSTLADTIGAQKITYLSDSSSYIEKIINWSNSKSVSININPLRSTPNAGKWIINNLNFTYSISDYMDSCELQQTISWAYLNESSIQQERIEIDRKKFISIVNIQFNELEKLYKKKKKREVSSLNPVIKKTVQIDSTTKRTLPEVRLPATTESR
ncbi:MAG: hypothetical protein HRT72_12140, partial [Flavobacteriales bacterium]|nr:hypothetical protein [Flavobacteriales bacterium]